MRRSLVEVWSTLLVLVGFAEPDPDAPPVERRGPWQLVVQTLLVAAVVAVVILLGRTVLGRADGSALLVVAALLLTVPLALHWFASPTRRVAGLGAAVAVTVGLGALGLVVVGLSAFWPAYLAVVAAFVIGSAVFGAVAPVTPAASVTVSD